MNVTITHYTTSQSGGAYWFWLFFSWKGAYWIRYNVGINLFWDLDFHILEPIEVSNCILFKFDNVNFGKPCFFFLSILQSYLDAVRAWFWLLLLGCNVTQMSFYICLWLTAGYGTRATCILFATRGIMFVADAFWAKADTAYTHYLIHVYTLHTSHKFAIAWVTWSLLALILVPAA